MNDSDPTIAVVVVQWFIKPGREEEFLRDRKPIRQAEGFLGEVLFRTIVDTDDPADDPPVVFLNTLYWRSREDFYRKRSHLKRWGGTGHERLRGESATAPLAGAGRLGPRGTSPRRH